MRRIVIILLLSSLAGSSYALDPDIFGYFEPQLMVSEIDGEMASLYSNKLRIDLETVPMEGVKFGANINYFNYSGKTSYNLLDYFPEAIRSEVSPGTEDDYSITFTDSIALDNAYVRLAFELGDLTAGRQQISYGTGYAWNPADVFNRKDLLDPTYEQPGHNAVRMDLPLSRASGILALYALGEDWDTPTAMLQLNSRFGGFDFSLSGITTEWNYTTYPAFETSGGWRRLIGGDLVGQLLGFGVWAEIAYNDLEQDEDFWEAVGGFDYTFRNGLYVLSEFYYHSEAPQAADDYTLTHWMQYYTGETLTLGQTQAYVFAQYPITDLITMGSSVIGCINDESVAVVPQLNYSLFQDVELTAFGNFYLGNEGTMYSKDLGNGGLIRLRVYF
jgi:hypothetical protein